MNIRLKCFRDLALMAVFFLGSSGFLRAQDIHPFPNPFVPSKGHVDVSFTPLPQSGSIKLYTFDGQEIRTLVINPGDAIKSWDGKNSSGKVVASGVFFFIVYEGDTIVSDGKIVVVR